LEPADIAEVVLFLASDASRAITGQEILADRGWAHS
jgi:NAD(P)-dependent dehydrogenase (short-subunit alcohol dehydrogenase family)